jgi:acetyl-CoA carboxylase carboxyltransferase component
MFRRTRGQTKSPAKEDRFRNTLLQDYLEATALNNEATREFEAVVGHPSGLPHPIRPTDQNASSKFHARERMITARHRLDDYLDRGIVLEDSTAAHDSILAGAVASPCQSKC